MKTNRGGATLMEVLMALLVMGIGVTSVIAIFPIAWMRSIQATQLTNGKLLADNARELIRTPIVHSVPGGSWRTLPSSERMHVLDCSLFRSGTVGIPADIDSQVFRGEWQPNMTYSVGQIVTPTENMRDRWFICTASAATPGLSGYVEPNWQETYSGQTIVDGQLQWSCEVVGNVQPVTANSYDALNYIVDPVGWNTLADNAADVLDDATIVNDFGYKTTNGIGSRSYFNSSDPINTRPLLRLNGGALTIQEAHAIAGMPDNWLPSQETKTTPVSINALGMTLSPKVDLTGISFGNHRVVVRSLLSKQVAHRAIDSINATTGTITWIEPLPAAFDQDSSTAGLQIADVEVQIEAYEPRYSWLATVNKSPLGARHVTFAVFFNRNSSPTDEHIYDANLGNVGAAGWAGVTNPDQIMIRWGTGEPKPLVRNGNYLLDARRARWYHIVTSDIGTDSEALPNYAVITVDKPIPPSDRTDFTAANRPGRVILMKGIIQLFTL